MNRGEQLAKLSQEHQASLTFAKKLRAVSLRGDKKEMLQTIEALKEYNETELELHFQHEERTIFAPIFKEHTAHIPLSKDLLKEHGVMRLLIPNMNEEEAQDQLMYFAALLEKHTLQEDKELFPIVAKEFSDEQLAAIVDFTPIH